MPLKMHPSLELLLSVVLDALLHNINAFFAGLWTTTFVILINLPERCSYFRCEASVQSSCGYDIE